jgi:hypothetical protein
MNQLNQIFVTTVRKAGGKNKSRLLIVPTLYESATYQSLNSFTLPQDTVKNKLIVEVHDYSSQFAQDINPLFSRLQSFADKVGAPVIIGEFGTTTSYQPSEYRATHAGNYVARAQKYGIKCIWWDNGGDYALIDRSKLTVKSKKLIKALTNPTVYKNSTLKTYSSMDYFLANKKFDEDGNVIDWVGWGSLVTDMDGKGIAVPENSKYMTASLSAGKGTGFSRIHLIYFYDKDGKLLKSYGQKYDYDALIYAVPEGAKYVRIGIYDRFTANRYDEYATWVAKSKIKLKIAWN